MKAIVVNLILGAVIVVGFGVFAIVTLMEQDRGVLRSWQRQQDLIGWSEKLVAERLGASSPGLVQTKTIQPHGEGNLWTVSGAYGLAGNRNAPSYVAVIEKTCRSSAERRCWRLQEISMGDMVPAALQRLAGTEPAMEKLPDSPASVEDSPLPSAETEAASAAPEPMPAAAVSAAPAVAALSPPPDQKVEPKAVALAALPDPGTPAPPPEPEPEAEPAAAEPEPEKRVWGRSVDAVAPATRTPAEPEPESEPAVALRAFDPLVRALQGELRALGYKTGPVDGIFGGRTQKAIRDYQAAQGLTVDGEPSRELLGHLQRGRGGTPTVVTSAAPQAAAPRPAAPAAPQSGSLADLRAGAVTKTGSEAESGEGLYPELDDEGLILLIQDRLIKLGYGPIRADGRMHPETRTAIRAYQRQHALEPAGLPTKGLLGHMERSLRSQGGTGSGTATN